jgi:CelD/BcsL family acetyltransferase involved in cellulose biosynthesis
MIPRLARRGALRVVFLKHDGRDVAYAFGGVLDGVYRGLQLSFDEAFRHLGLGNLAQYFMIEFLASNGVEYYDLGSELDYKSRWGDEIFETVALWVWQRKV